MKTVRKAVALICEILYNRNILKEKMTYMNYEFNKMKELEIIKLIKDPNTDQYTYNKACEFLLEKYTPMFHKNWWTLQRQMANSALVNNLKEEYYSEAYQAFVIVLQKVDLSRVYDEKFKIMQLLSFYLRNVRTKLIKETLRKSKVKSMISMQEHSDEEVSTIDPDVEISYWENEGYKNNPEYICEQQNMEEFSEKVIKNCLNNWTDTQKQIYKYLKQKKTRAEIAKTLELPPVKLYKEITSMKNDIKAAFVTN